MAREGAADTQPTAPTADAAQARSNPSAVLQLGVQHHQAGRLDQAEQVYRLVHEAAPRNADALHLLGLAALHKNMPGEALRLINDAIALSPDSPAYLTNRARALARLNRTDEALDAYRAALAIDETNIGALDGLGHLLRDLDRTAEAIETLEKATALMPNEAALQINLGNAYQSDGRLDDAVACYRRVLEIQGETSAAHSNLGLALFLLGDREQAIEHYRRALIQNPQVAEIHLGLGWALFGVEHLDEAEACFVRARELKPTLAEAHVKMGLVHLAKNRCDEAFHAFAQSAALLRTPPRKTARFKIRHDLEHADYLARTGVISDARHEHAKTLLTGALGAMPADLSEERAIALSQAQVKALGLADAVPQHRPSCPAQPAGALNQALDTQAIEEAYFAADPSVISVDGLLSPAALDALRHYCWSAAIWDDVKFGYLGAYVKDGFACGLLMQIVTELRAKLPRILADHPLIEMWAYKYDQTLGGIQTHADCAAVNLNFWISPDDANRDPDSGGLILYTREAPLDWDFHRYNRHTEGIEAFLDEAGRDAVTVSHRANRAVIFNSNLFHRTDTFRFAPGYENRRINITLLFGHRASRPRA